MDSEPILPTHEVKVGWATYQIVFVMPVEAEQLKIYGQTRHIERTIRVTSHYGMRQLAHTLLHEIYHLVYRLWSMDILVTDKIPADDREESLVLVMTDAMATVMRDNKELFRWIVDQLSCTNDFFYPSFQYGATP